MKSWWLGFPRLRCPHCGKVIEGIKFSGRWKLPRVKKNLPVVAGTSVILTSEDGAQVSRVGIPLRASRVKRNPPGKAEIVEALAEIGPDEDAESKREEGRDP